MIRTATRVFAVLALPAAFAVSGGTALAKHTHTSTSPVTLGGNAVYNSSGALLTSNSTAPGYGSLSLPVPSGTTLSSINSLDATYQMTAGDCGGGSPRYSITLANGKNIFAYFGQPPNYNSCANGVQSQSNLLQPNVDTSQLPGGTFYDTWSHALQL